jgi:hypothetical protein
MKPVGALAVSSRARKMVIPPELISEDARLILL